MRFGKTSLVVVILSAYLAGCGTVLTARSKESKPRYSPTSLTTSLAQMRTNAAFQRGASAYADEEYAIAFQRWSALAHAGNVPAQGAIGFMFAVGQGTEQSDAEAIHWLEQAATAGDADAQHNLGYMFAMGRGVEKNIDEAVKWYLEAAKNGQIATSHNLHALFLGPKFGEPIERPSPIDVRGMAERGEADAQFVLAAQYFSGYGVKRDVHDAVQWYQRAAEQSHGPAQFQLGLIYVEGQGVAKNERTGIAWIRRAAAQNYSPAQSWLNENSQRYRTSMNY